MSALESNDQQSDRSLCDVCLKMTTTMSGLNASVSHDGYAHIIKPGTAHECSLCAIILGDSDHQEETVSRIKIQHFTTHDSRKTLRENFESPFGFIECLRVFSLVKEESELKLVFKLDIKAYVLKCKFKVISECKMLGLTSSKADPYVSCFMNVLPLDDFSEESVYTGMASWLWQCQNKHTDCPNSDDPALPKRVLDLGESVIAGVKLHISQPSEHGRYVALSYCWGGPQQLTTTTSTIDAKIEGISSESFPRTIQDAIFVTKKLGIRYLWVDALCIVQDDEDDKRQELDLMGELYKNSTVTIFAATAKKVTDGFLQCILPLKMCRLPLSLADGSSGAIYFQQKGNRKARAGEPLLTRGWAFQELLLSPRIIFFDEFQATWSCHKDKFKELVKGYVNYGAHTFTRDFSNRNLRAEKLSGLAFTWLMLVNQYTRRDLTLFEDRLPAISGIARELHSIWKDQYIAGFWKSSILQQLAWYRRENHTSFTPFQNFDPKRIGLPTWSWKSAPFPVWMDGTLTEEATEVATTLHGYEVKLKSDQAPFGEVIEARLYISGKLMKLPKSVLQQGRSFTLKMDFGQSSNLIMDYPSTKLDDNSRLLLLVRPRFYSKYCIVVQKQENNVYQRVGSYSYDDLIMKLDWGSIIPEDFVLE